MTIILQDTGGQKWQLGIDNTGEFLNITEVGSGAVTPVFLNSAGVSWQLLVVGTAPNSTLEITAVGFNSGYPAGVVIQSPNSNSWTISIVNNNLVATPGGGGGGGSTIITWLGVSLASKRKRGWH